MPVRGIDISYAQPHVDFHKVKAAGVDFVIFKVNEGDQLDRSTTRDRVRAAKRAGLLVGGYNYVHPRTTRRGSTEYDIFHKRAAEVGLLDKGCLRPWLDFETTHTTKFLTRRYVSSWIKRALARTGKHPEIYAGYYFWNSFGFKTDFNCKLVLPAYGVSEHWVHNHVPAPFSHVAFWQKDGHGRVAGVAGEVDLDVYFGTYHQLRRLHTL